VGDAELTAPRAREQRFTAGLGLDGPREVHDGCRRDRGGKATPSTRWTTTCWRASPTLRQAPAAGPPPVAVDQADHGGLDQARPRGLLTAHG